MSFAKIPFIFLFGWSLHVGANPPNSVTPKEVERTITDNLLHFKLLATVASITEVSQVIIEHS